MKKKLIYIAYLIGVLMLISFTIVRSSLPGIMHEYKYQIIGVTLLIVGIAFYAQRKSSNSR